MADLLGHRKLHSSCIGICSILTFLQVACGTDMSTIGFSIRLNATSTTNGEQHSSGMTKVYSEELSSRRISLVPLT